MKTIRRSLCVALAVFVLITATLPALAEIRLVPESVPLYMNSKNGKDYTATRNITISGIDSDSKITDPKSSKPSVLRIDQLNIEKTHLEALSGTSYEEISAKLSVRLKKPGEATVSVKVNGETYKTKVEVAEYVNPVKSFVITGISGKNLKSQFNTSGSASGALTSDAKAGQVRLTAANDWKIRKIGLICLDDIIMYERVPGPKTCVLDIPAMKKGNYYIIGARLESTITGGFIDILYTIM